MQEKGKEAARKNKAGCHSGQRYQRIHAQGGSHFAVNQQQERPCCSTGRTGKGGQSPEQTGRQQLRDRREPKGYQDQNTDPSVDDPEFYIPGLPLFEPYMHGPPSLEQAFGMTFSSFMDSSLNRRRRPWPP